MRKKIGIATYINTYNYGSVLQAYALTEYISSLGYDASVIDFTNMAYPHNVRMRKILLKDRLACCIKHPTLLLKEFSRRKVAQQSVSVTSPEKKALFQAFQNSQMKFSNEDYFDPHKFDVFVCGSDQIWKISVPGLHSFYFLRFAPPYKRIAYAPSFGGNKIPTFNRNVLQHYLNEIPYLSVRESSGVEIVCELTQKTIPQVLDPVLLVGAEFWRQRYINVTEAEPFVLCYLLDENFPALEYARKIAMENKCTLLNISDGNKDGTTAPNPLNFVQLIDTAFFVVTDSFHGIAFSAMFNTPFTVFDRNYSISGEQSTRIESFLTYSKLENRQYSTSNKPTLEVDFTECNEYLDKASEKSAIYLKESISHSLCSQEEPYGTM